MKIAYAFRREAWYPHFGGGTALMPEASRGPWLNKVEEMGFDGTIAVEGLRLGDAIHGDEKSCAYMRELASQLS